MASSTVPGGSGPSGASAPIEIDCYPSVPVTAIHPAASPQLLEQQAIFLLGSASATLEFISAHPSFLDEMTPQGIADLMCGPLNLMLNAKSMVEAASALRQRGASSPEAPAPN